MKPQPMPNSARRPPLSGAMRQARWRAKKARDLLELRGQLAEARGQGYLPHAALKDSLAKATNDLAEARRRKQKADDETAAAQRDRADLCRDILALRAELDALRGSVTPAVRLQLDQRLKKAGFGDLCARAESAVAVGSTGTECARPGAPADARAQQAAATDPHRRPASPPSPFGPPAPPPPTTGMEIWQTA